MTREEILESCGVNFDKESGWLFDGSVENVLLSMDEWAKQQAIAFEKWKVSEGWLPEEGSTVYRSWCHNTEPTLQELYNLFLEHQKQQQ